MSRDEHAQARARLRLAWGMAPEAAAPTPEAAPELTDAQILSLARQDEALSTYERLRAESPFRAAHYLLQIHPKEFGTHLHSPQKILGN